MAAVTVETVAQAGVVGAGGAGFPTHVKLRGQADSVLLNAAECEPLLHKDKEVLRDYAEGVLAGLAAGMALVGASRGYVGVKEKYTEVIDVLRPMLPAGIEIAPLQDAYPAGDEFLLVHEVLGRVIPPGGIPLHVGAVVMNVETALNVALSPATPVVDKFISVAGAVAHPCTLKVPVGVTLGECIEAAGGATIPDPHYVVGGAMMGRLEASADALVTKTTGAVIVLPGDHSVVRRFAGTWSTIQRVGRAACDQCSFCTELCPRYLLGHPIEPHRAMRSLGFNEVGQANVIGTQFCCECNLCSVYSCPEWLDPKNVCAQNKRRLAADKVRWQDPPFSPRRAETMLPNRKAPMSKLIRRLDLHGFDNVGPMRPGPARIGRVGIPLRQHIGAPCQPTVQPGQRVRRGDLVGSVGLADGKPALGAPVHASIDGTVEAVADGIVWIQA